MLDFIYIYKVCKKSLMLLMLAQIKWKILQKDLLQHKTIKQHMQTEYYNDTYKPITVQNKHTTEAAGSFWNKEY